MSEIKRIEIIGRGNVATHLRNALENYSVNLINPHTLENLDRDSDLILIAVTDDAIKEVSNKIGNTNAIVAHTSGTTPIDILERVGSPYGVFYPLQTFSKDIKLNYRKIPFFIEGADNDTEVALKSLAAHISDSVYAVDSNKRKVLHVASVFACNFVNHLWGAANKILADNHIPFTALTPLIEETIRKATASGEPYSVQTGPAVRGDKATMSQHLDMLRNYPELRELYSILSESIQITSKNIRNVRN